MGKIKVQRGKGKVGMVGGRHGTGLRRKRKQGGREKKKGREVVWEKAV